jgi:hypothetical protein
MISCEYENDKTYFKEVSKPSAEGLSLALANTDGDTIGISGPTYLTYVAVTNGGQWRGMSIFLDNTLIAQPPPDGFNFDPSPYAEGVHQFRLEYHATTGSKSLAGVIGIEEFVLTRNYVLVIDRTPIHTIDITSITAKDGTLVLQWPRYKPYNFRAYVLTKSIYDPVGGGYAYAWSTEIQGKGNTTYNDVTFHGGKALYQLQIKAANGDTGPASSREYTYDYNPSLTYEWVDKTHAKLTWRKTPFYNNFLVYNFTFYNHSSIELHTLDNVADTSVVVEPQIFFVEKQLAKVEVWSPVAFVANSSMVTLKLGTEFPSFYDRHIEYSKSLDKYFTIAKDAANNNQLVRINGTTHAIEQTLSLYGGNFALSDNGQYLYIARDNLLRQIDPLNFSTLVTHDLNDIDNTYKGYYDGLQVSDNHFVTLKAGGESLVLKMPAMTVLMRTPDNQRMVISPSGNHLVAANQVWEWNGTQFDAKATLSGTYYGAIFRNDSQILLTEYEKASVFNLSTLNISSTFPISSYGETLVYDKGSDLAGFYNVDYSSPLVTYRLYDLTTGDLAELFDIGNPQISNGQYVILLNNQLICSTGSILPLSYYYP